MNQYTIQETEERGEHSTDWVPKLIRMTIILVTLIALMLGIRACREETLDMQPEELQVAASGESQQSQMEAEAGAEAADTLAETPEQPASPSEIGELSEAVDEGHDGRSPAAAVDGGQVDHTALAEEGRARARNVKAPQDLGNYTFRKPEDVYHRLAIAQLYEARLMLELAKPYLPPGSHNDVSRILADTEKSMRSFAPMYYQTRMVLSRTTARIAHEWVGVMMGLQPDMSEWVRQADMVVFDTGEAANSGVYAELQIVNWLEFLRSTGGRAQTRADWLEALYRDLPRGPSVARAQASLVLSIDAFLAASAFLPGGTGMNAIAQDKRREIEAITAMHGGVYEKQLRLVEARISLLRAYALSQ